VTIEYKRLARIRQDLYYKYIQGRLERPPVLQGWIKRHPNTYWLDNMPYIETRPTFTCIDDPRILGKKGDTSEFMRLLMLQAYGSIQFRASKPVCPTFVELAKAGILEECNFKVMPLSEEGVSSQLIGLAPKGFPGWFERNHLCPIRLSDEDTVLKATELWAFCPWASLRMAIMMFNYLKEVNRPLDMDGYIWITGIHRQLSQPDQSSFEDLDPEPDPLVAQESISKEILSEHIRDVLRDWYPDIDAQMEEIRKRIIPRASSSVDPDLRISVLQSLTSDPWSLLPEKERGLGGNEDREDSESNSSVFDPWAELGVT
jgi:hypothetical protein